MKMKRILALLLVSVFLLGAFAGCKNEPVDSDVGESTVSGSDNGEDVTPGGDSDEQPGEDDGESSEEDMYGEDDLGGSDNTTPPGSDGSYGNETGVTYIDRTGVTYVDRTGVTYVDRTGVTYIEGTTGKPTDSEPTANKPTANKPTTTKPTDGDGETPGDEAAAIYFDVTDYGAKKDGSADASEAIQKAINAAAEVKGGIVYLPAGRYLMEAGVDVLMGVSIRGETPTTKKKWRAVSNLGTQNYAFESTGDSWLDADNFAGTWIIVNHGAGDAESHATFQMQGNASIMGLGFVHKNTAPIVSKITVYPPAIGIVNTKELPFTREGMTVENIVLLNAYIGIAFHAGNGKVLDHEIGTSWEGHLSSLGRMRVHNVTGGCTYRGMILKGLLDTVDIQDVEFGYTNMEKTYATQRAQKCADFEWYRADGSSAKNIFSFGAKYGILTTPAYNSGSSSIRMSDAELIGQYPLYLTASGQYELTDCTFTTMNFNKLVTEKSFRAMTVIQDTTSIHQSHNLFTNLKLVNKVQSASLNDYNLYIETKHAGAPAMMLFSDITFEGWSPDNTNAAVYYEAAGSSYIGYASFYNCKAMGGSSSAGRLFQIVNVPKGGLQFNKCTFPKKLVDNAGDTNSVWIQD